MSPAGMSCIEMALKDEINQEPLYRWHANEISQPERRKENRHGRSSESSEFHKTTHWIKEKHRRSLQKASNSIRLITGREARAGGHFIELRAPANQALDTKQAPAVLLRASNSRELIKGHETNTGGHFRVLQNSSKLTAERNASTGCHS